MNYSDPQSRELSAPQFTRRKAMAGAGLGITAMALPRAAVAASNGDFTGAGYPAETNMTMTLRYNVSGTRQIRLNLYRTSYVSGTMTATVNWGDGTSNNYSTAGSTILPTRTYASNGVYDITITATSGIGYGSGTGGSYSTINQDMLTDVLSWNNIGGLVSAFDSCTNLVSVPNMLPLGVANLSHAFNGCTNFNSPLNNWTTSWVTDMSKTFQACKAFDQNVGTWDTSAVTKMDWMFNQAFVFNNGGNSSINNWSTANVTDMNHMFSTAYAFNQPIGAWNTAKVTDMSWMFYFARAFNQDISTWNTGAVTSMANMFYCTSSPNMAFDQDISGWNVTNVTSYSNFIKATAPQYISAGWTSSERPSKFGL